MGEQQAGASPATRRARPTGDGARPQLVLALAVLTAIILGFLAFRAVSSSGGPTQLAEAEAYLRAWAEGDYEAMAAATADPPPDFTLLHQQMTGSLQVRESMFDSRPAEITDDRATVAFTAHLTLAGLGVWDYDNELHLVRHDGAWLVDWSPATLYPGTVEGQRFIRTRTAPVRGAVVDRNGLPLSETTAPLIVGTTGPATAEQAAALGMLVEVGDTVGTQGLQARFNDVLSGEPSGQVQLLDATGIPEIIHVFQGSPGAPLVTTFDPVVQAAADNAVSISSGPTAFVAIEPGTGEILAVANSPSDGLNRPISGAYPPGSTFKVITANALLGVGVDPDVNVTCPATANGFGNHAGEVLGTIPFREAFYRSCNTSFIIQAGLLPEGSLEASAEQFGFNTPYDIGIDAVGGSFPTPESQAELLAGSIGQGVVTASPLHMATVAAAVDDGSWRAPTLIHGDQAPERPDPMPLDEGIDEMLSDMMLEVVTLGTGTPAAVPGRDVRGKTGTAEFGPEDPPETHAWFIGFDENVAFACLVEGGGSGGGVAGPVAARFVAGLPAPPPPPTTTTTADEAQDD